MRLILALLCLPLLAGCADPGFIHSDATAPAPPLLPVEEILATTSPTLNAEAAAALQSRGDALRSRAATTP
ncbi:hypothetical protein GU927_015280 [Rhodobacteraceae bacterium HSP-20]|uniref:DUF3035 domain-containing protein n=1 Tax=Paragemmobacter amnigenus TaxID=2852097 RepID=A0ABS6J6N1_9RHOB|nr:hypothetical protein [Rhodobacter amnigenus]MBU9699212.1 hypothetical protein [Rhodobacter amnigenus]MBV4390439.1 hypothetical protein [Rhodobacter amnigenus]